MIRAGNDADEESDFSFRKIRLGIILAVANTFGTVGVAHIALTLINLSVTKEFGWTQQEFSWAQAALMWCSAAMLPFCGYLIDSLGVRPVVIFGSLGIAVGTFCLGLMTGELWQIYLIYGFLGLCGSVALGYSKIIGAMFSKHRGKAIALLGMESTLAMAAIPPMENWLISEFGWRWMYFACGIITFLLVLLVYFTVDEPGEVKSDRRLMRRDGAKKPDRPELPGLTAQEVFRDRVYWLIVLATITATAPRNGTNIFLVPMMSEKGFTQADAALYLSMTAMIGLAGSLVGGWALDRFNDSRVAVPFQAISFFGMLAFTLATISFGGWGMMGLSVALSGFAGGTARSFGTYLHIRFFGLKAFGFYQGLEVALLFLVMGGVAPAVAALRDASGSYYSTYVLMLIGLAIGTGLYWIMGPYRYPADMREPVAEPAPEIDIRRRA